MIYVTNGDKVWIKVGNPRCKNMIEAFDEPRSVFPDIVFVRNRSETGEQPAIR